MTIDKPLAPPLIPAWFRDETGREYPVLARADNGQLRILFFDESVGVASATRALAESRYLRPITNINGIEYSVEVARERYLDFAHRQGCDAGAARELGLPAAIPKPVYEGQLAPPRARAVQATAALNELYTRAAKLLGTPEEQLREKYAHLNHGLQSMNLRNRLCAKGFNV